MDECIKSPGDATIFWMLDAISAYWQVKVADEVCDTTFFASYHDLFRFIRVLFCLKRTQDVSTCDGYQTIPGEAAVCTGLYRCYRHIFKVTRRAYRPRMINIDGIERC